MHIHHVSRLAVIAHMFAIQLQANIKYGPHINDFLGTNNHAHVTIITAMTAVVSYETTRVNY
jgi:hypothetical protein